MKKIAMLGLFVVLGAADPVVSPALPVPSAHTQATVQSVPSSATAKTTGHAAAVRVVEGVTLISHSEAASVHGQGCLSELLDWILEKLGNRKGR